MRAHQKGQIISDFKILLLCLYIYHIHHSLTFDTLKSVLMITFFSKNNTISLTRTWLILFDEDMVK